MNQKLKALSADLWRISYWLATGSDLLAKKFIQRDIGLYSSILLNVGKRDLQKELRKIKSLDRAAERALTLSVLLSHKI